MHPLSSFQQSTKIRIVSRLGRSKAFLSQLHSQIILYQTAIHRQPFQPNPFITVFTYFVVYRLCITLARTFRFSLLSFINEKPHPDRWGIDSPLLFILYPSSYPSIRRKTDDITTAPYYYLRPSAVSNYFYGRPP
jgi:hypothetical protein